MCGTTLNSDLADATTPKTIALASGQTLAAGTKCSYVVKSTYGAPIFKWGGSANTDLQISLIQFTKDARVTTMDSNVAYYPAITTTIADTTTGYTEGPFSRQAIVNAVTTEFTAAQIITEISDYNTAKATYESEVATIKEENDKVRPQNWWEMALGMIAETKKEYPKYIGAYTGKTFFNTLPVAGYGSPTSVAYKTTNIPDNTKYVRYGEYGATTDTDKNIDTNTDLSAERYLVVSFINEGSGTLAETVVTGTVSVGTWDSTI